MLFAKKRKLCDKMEIFKEKMGHIGEEVVYALTLKNSQGITVTCINYGCRITSIKTPDKKGHIADIVLGYDHLADYITDQAYLGAICGRVAGRIKRGHFYLDEGEIQLSQNDGRHHIHGGISNFSHALWSFETEKSKETAAIKFFYTSKHLEEGYPGEVDVTVTYMLNEKNQFVITYHGQAKEKTVINLTNHTYFNLNQNSPNILNHDLQIRSEKFLELDEEALPTGRLLSTEKTPFDLTCKKRLKKQLIEKHPQLEMAKNGYNHPFILTNHFEEEIILSEEISGRKLTVETDCPSVVVYTASYFNEDFLIKGKKAAKYMGICLETQGFPDAVNHGHFPSIVLEEGEAYESTTRYTFGVL